MARFEQQRAFALVAGHGGGALELDLRLFHAAELGQEIAADARQQVIILQRRFVDQLIDEIQPGLRAEGHRQGDRAVELDDGRGR